MKPKELREKGLAEGFLKFRGLAFTNLRLLGEFCPDHDRIGIAGPDVKVDLVTEDGPQPIAIEIAEYHHDVGQHGSAGRSIKRACEHFREDAYAACVAKNRNLANFCPQVKFRHDRIPNQSGILGLACDFAEFLNAESGNIGKYMSFYASEFQDYPKLARHLESIQVFGRQHPVSKLEWFGSYATQIGVHSKEICRLIGDHSKGNYARDDVAEAWMLICSTPERGSGVGPEVVQRPELHNTAIDECVKNVRCRFRHVFFWEQNFSWYEELGNT